MNRSPSKLRAALVRSRDDIGRIVVVKLNNSDRAGILRCVDGTIAGIELIPASHIAKHRRFELVFDEARETSMKGHLFHRTLIPGAPFNRCIYVAARKVRFVSMGNLGRCPADVLQLVSAFCGDRGSVALLAVRCGALQKRLRPKGTDPKGLPATVAANTAVIALHGIALPSPTKDQYRALAKQRRAASAATQAAHEALAAGTATEATIAAVPDAELELPEPTFNLTLLASAVTFGAPVDLIAALCRRGCQVVTTSRGGRGASPLHIAVDHRDADRVAALLAHCTTDPAAAILTSTTPEMLGCPLALATEKGKQALLPLLLPHLAKATAETINTVLAFMEANACGLDNPVTAPHWRDLFAALPAAWWEKMDPIAGCIRVDMTPEALARLRALLHASPPQALGTTDAFGQSLLHRAVQTGRQDVVAAVAELCAHQAWTRDASGETPLMAALRRWRRRWSADREAVIEELWGACCNGTPRVRAADQLAACRLGLLAACLESHCRFAADVIKPHVLAQLTAGEPWLTPADVAPALHAAIFARDEDTVRSLLAFAPGAAAAAVGHLNALGAAVVAGDERVFAAILQLSSATAGAGLYAAVNGSHLNSAMAAALRCGLGSSNKAAAQAHQQFLVTAFDAVNHSCAAELFQSALLLPSFDAETIAAWFPPRAVGAAPFELPSMGPWAAVRGRWATYGEQFIAQALRLPAADAATALLDGITCAITTLKSADVAMALTRGLAAARLDLSQIDTHPPPRPTFEDDLSARVWRELGPALVEGAGLTSLRTANWRPLRGCVPWRTATAPHACSAHGRSPMRRPSRVFTNEVSRRACRFLAAGRLADAVVLLGAYAKKLPRDAPLQPSGAFQNGLLQRPPAKEDRGGHDAFWLLRVWGSKLRTNRPSVGTLLVEAIADPTSRPTRAPHSLPHASPHYMRPALRQHASTSSPTTT
jgi:hypothetical protein